MKADTIDQLGWAFLVLAVLCGGIGAGYVYGIGHGFLASAAGFLLAATVVGIRHSA